MITFFRKKTFWKKTLTGLLVLATIAPSIWGVLPPPAQGSVSDCAAAFSAAVSAVIAGFITAGATSVPTNTNQQVSQSETAGNSMATLIKNCIEEGLALSIGRMLLAQMTSQIINYINSGFQGSPAFVGNPGQYFSNIGDQIFANTINNLSEGSLGINLCSPFKVQLIAALEVNYGISVSGSGGDIYQTQYNGCTLEQIGANLNTAYESFSNWQDFLAMSMNADSNPYGAFLYATNAITAKINDQINLNASELNWGNGFLSQKECTHIDGNGNTFTYTEPGGNGPSTSVTNVTSGSVTTPTSGAKGTSAATAGYKPEVGAIKIGTDGGTTIYSDPYSDKCTITTPGQTIAGVLQNQLNIPAQQLGVADDLDKIFNSLFNELLKTGLGALGFGQGGLLTASPSAWSTANADASAGLQAAGTSATDQANQVSNSLNTIPQNGSTGGATNNTSNGSAPTNVALNATVTASPGIYPPFELSNLTNGITAMSGWIVNRNPLTFNPNYGVVTQPSQNASLTIDLGQQFNNIYKIVIYPHNPTPGIDWWYIGTPVGSQYVDSFKVLAMDNNNNLVWDSSSSYQPMSTFNGNPYTLYINPSISARYISIQGLNYGTLQLADVEVYKDNGPIISLNGSASIQAISGNTLGSYDQGATATDVNGNPVSITTTYTDQNGNTVNPSTPIQSGQNYTITYSATDSYGVSSEITRSVQTTYYNNQIYTTPSNTTGTNITHA